MVLREVNRRRLWKRSCPDLNPRPRHVREQKKRGWGVYLADAMMLMMLPGEECLVY